MQMLKACRGSASTWDLTSTILATGDVCWLPSPTKSQHATQKWQFDGFDVEVSLRTENRFDQHFDRQTLAAAEIGVDTSHWFWQPVGFWEAACWPLTIIGGWNEAVCPQVKVHGMAMSARYRDFGEHRGRSGKKVAGRRRILGTFSVGQSCHEEHPMV